MTPVSQEEISREIRTIEADATRRVLEGGAREVHPRRDYPPYRSSLGF